MTKTMTMPSLDKMTITMSKSMKFTTNVQIYVKGTNGILYDNHHNNKNSYNFNSDME